LGSIHSELLKINDYKYAFQITKFLVGHKPKAYISRFLGLAEQHNKLHDIIHINFLTSAILFKKSLSTFSIIYELYIF